MTSRRLPHELEKMRRAGRIVAQTLRHLSQMVAPGVTTLDLDKEAESFIRAAGGVPSFLGYRGYPGTVCASVNDEIVHGIPGQRVLAEGDIISIDVGAIWEGYQGDAALTVGVGCVSGAAQRLMDATRSALYAGIAAVHDGVRLGDVSHAIEQSARASGLEIVREYGGHGIGREMHEGPHILNWGPPGGGIKLRQGMTICLEPMLTLGGFETRLTGNRWTVVTADGSLAAHFEHTIAVTMDGAEILTLDDETGWEAMG
ncbi:MAG: type I methionyl aminopeptidase [Anaerolineae bacterium]|jgi:methionyl aminopeptidase|nr:type I methionyl aminopeptidase [Chloroflexota bacterium]